MDMGNYGAPSAMPSLSTFGLVSPQQQHIQSLLASLQESRSSPTAADMFRGNDADQRARNFMNTLNPQDLADLQRAQGVPLEQLHAFGPATFAHGGLPIDSEKRDTVPAMLSPGEIVLPRSVAQDEDAPERAAEFVANIKKHKKAKGGEVHPLARLPEIRQKLKELQSLLAAQ
jgi:hypothetical protein